jgi:hypothetical protein
MNSLGHRFALGRTTPFTERNPIHPAGGRRRIFRSGCAVEQRVARETVVLLRQVSFPKHPRRERVVGIEEHQDRTEAERDREREPRALHLTTSRKSSVTAT